MHWFGLAGSSLNHDARQARREMLLTATTSFNKQRKKKEGR
jgi:hypothetical protein